MSYEETASDLNIKYSNCLGKTEEQPVFLEYFDSGFDTNISVSVKFIKETASGEIINTTSDISVGEFEDTIDMTFPDAGAINFKRGVLLATRCLYVESPLKYRKGLTQSSLDVLDPNILERDKIDNFRISSMSRNKLVINISKSLFFPSKVTGSEALYSILTGDRYGAIINNSVYITFSLVTDKVYLWKNTSIVGEYNYDTELFETTTDLFSEELSLLQLDIA